MKQCSEPDGPEPRADRQCGTSLPLSLSDRSSPYAAPADSEEIHASASLLKPLLYGICWLTDFAAFVVVFAVSRGLAEANSESWYLGLVGAGLSFSSGIGSLSGGWLAHRFDGRVVFLAGAGLMQVSILACSLSDLTRPWFLPFYWLLGIALGLLYPPLIGWLNQGEDIQGNRRGVSRTLILFCVAWNLGMMGGQLAAGTLFSAGAAWTYGAALLSGALNIVVAVFAVRQVRPTVVTGVTGGRPDASMAALASAFKRLSWIANLGGMFGGSMVIHLLPDLAVTIGVPADAHGQMLACWRAVIIATYLVMHNVAFWHYRHSTAVASQVLAATGLLVIASAESGLTLLIGLSLLGQLVGYNYFSGLFYSTVGSDNERRALAAGIHEATLAAGMAIGTLVGGWLGTVVDQRLPYTVAAFVLLILIAVQAAAWYRWVRPLRGNADRQS